MRLGSLRQHAPGRCMGLLPLMALWVTVPVHAQTARSGGEAQKFMQQYQQVAAEKTALQAQVTQLKKDAADAQTQLAAVKKERDTLQVRVGGSAAAVSQLNASKQATEKNLDQYKQRLGELVAKFRDMAGNLKDVEAERTQLRKTLDERSTAYDTCAANNLELYEINGQVLDRLNRVGLFTKVSAEEPFTRITRTRLDNLVVETRERALELRLKKAAP